MKKAIILNGAPCSGKDTIGAIISSNYDNVALRSFKDPMFEIARAILGDAQFEYFMFLYEDRQYKEEPASILNGKSPRQFMIWISEEVIKPQFGNRFFGMRAEGKVKESDRLSLFTDGGFKDEILQLIEGGIEVKMCRIHRDGCNFNNDSRSYIYLDEMIGVNGYQECDFFSVEGQPEVVAAQIAATFIEE